MSKIFEKHTFEELYNERKEKIINAEDSLTAEGNVYYVSIDGNDNNDGKSPDKAWKTLEKVSEVDLEYGDCVCFRRGDVFRGTVMAKQGVTYCAYGEGEKPKFYGGDMDYADSSLWELVGKEKNIWKCKLKMLDAGTLVFNYGEKHSRKLIPSYKHGKFVCRDNEEKVFDYNEEMTENLDIYWHYDATFSTNESRGENFPIPDIRGNYGELYLRCDEGNPGEIFKSIEAVAGRYMFLVRDNADVRIDNVCIKYVGLHAIAAGGHVKGLTVTNCEIGWIGGCIQHYSGTDPNYPRGGRGTVTRFGNGVEIYGGCEEFTVSDCYVYECYDAGLTHQITTDKKVVMTGIRYVNNLIEKCVYGIEYFLNQINGERESYMDDVLIDGNIIRLSGYGWGQQRHNKETPAHIKGWSYINTARKFVISNNIFDRSAYRMLHLVALKDEYCPEMKNNTYIQNEGKMLGQFGGNENGEPEVVFFNKSNEEKIRSVFKDTDARIYHIED